MLRELNLLRRGPRFPAERAEGLRGPYIISASLLALLFMVFCFQMALAASLNHRIREVEAQIARHQSAAETYRKLVQLEEMNRSKEARLQGLLATEAP